MILLPRQVCEEAAVKCPRCGRALRAWFRTYRMEYPATPNEAPHRALKPHRLDCRACAFEISLASSPAPKAQR